MSSNPLSKISFVQALTFFGMVSIIVAIISSFFYAVTHDWITEAMQVMIGIGVGLGLFGLGFAVHKRHSLWSNMVIGGALLIEYISIAFGVLYYEIISSYAGVALSAFFLVAAMVSSWHFASRTIGYFSLVGGYCVPLISGFYSSYLYVMVYYGILTLAMLGLSLRNNWHDLRMSSFISFMFFATPFIVEAYDQPILVAAVIFLLAMYLLYFMATIRGILVSSETQLRWVFDAVLLVLYPFFFFTSLYGFLEDYSFWYGGIMLGIALMNGLGGYFIQQRQNSERQFLFSILLYASTTIAMLVGVINFMEFLQADFLMFFFVVFWFFFGYLPLYNWKYHQLFRVISSLFLFLSLYWYLVIVRFDEGLLHASIFMSLFVAMVAGMWYFSHRGEWTDFYTPAWMLWGFAVLFSLSKYLAFFIASSDLRIALVSVFWLIYALALFHFSTTRDERIVIALMLGFTILKIAFYDLFLLEGIYRIGGFFSFGVLLLIGGYFLKDHLR